MASETPGNLGVRGNVLEARPGHVVGGVADAKHGIEQLLDQAASPCTLLMPPRQVRQSSLRYQPSSTSPFGV